MFPRIIIGLLALILLFSFVKKIRARLALSKKSLSGQKTVRCGHCGVYVPEGESVKKGDQIFCSEAHADAEGRR